MDGSFTLSEYDPKQMELIWSTLKVVDESRFWMIRNSRLTRLPASCRQADRGALEQHLVAGGTVSCCDTLLEWDHSSDTLLEWDHPRVNLRNQPKLLSRDKNRWLRLWLVTLAVQLWLAVNRALIRRLLWLEFIKSRKMNSLGNKSSVKSSLI